MCWAAMPFRAPATPLEAALCAIIGSVLGRDALGADDDFFASAAIRCWPPRWSPGCGTWLDTPSVAVADIFAARTAAALAARLIAAESDSDRLTEVAELYLEVSGMDGAEVLSALDSAAMIGEQDQLALRTVDQEVPGAAGRPSTIVFPHAGGAAAAYRGFASALSDQGVDTYIVQYPQRGERLAHPAPETIAELAAQMFDAADWARLGPLRLFGHCMGALVGLRVRPARRASAVSPVRELWASASQAPSTVAGSRPVPTTDREMLADIVDLGGTDARLLEDEDFLELLLPAVRADYQAFNRYACGRDVRIGADIHVRRRPGRPSGRAGPVAAVGDSHRRRVHVHDVRRWSLLPRRSPRRGRRAGELHMTDDPVVIVGMAVEAPGGVDDTDELLGAAVRAA